MKAIVVTFPGSNCDRDCIYVLRDLLDCKVRNIFHKETSLGECDAVIVPGGFSYGDYLRAGALAKYSPIMPAIKHFAERGGLVIGICNGFQILCEVGLLPGALVRNRSVRFHFPQCRTARRKTARQLSHHLMRGVKNSGFRSPTPKATTWLMKRQ